MINTSQQLVQRWYSAADQNQNIDTTQKQQLYDDTKLMANSINALYEVPPDVVESRAIKLYRFVMEAIWKSESDKEKAVKLCDDIMQELIGHGSESEKKARFKKLARWISQHSSYEPNTVHLMTLTV